MLAKLTVPAGSGKYSYFSSLPSRASMTLSIVYIGDSPQIFRRSPSAVAVGPDVHEKPVGVDLLDALEFDAKLLRRWHLYRMCTNGLSGLWMSHYADAVHMLTGAKYPVRVTAGGGTFVWKDGREHCDTFHALLEYPEGFLMDWSMGLANSAGIHFNVHGTEGTLDAHHWSVSGAGGRKGTKVTSRKLELEPNISHMGNWLECLRSRRRPVADIQFGHQHAVATIMAATALHTGQRQQYDVGKRLAMVG